MASSRVEPCLFLFIRVSPLFSLRNILWNILRLLSATCKCSKSSFIPNSNVSVSLEFLPETFAVHAVSGEPLPSSRLKVSSRKPPTCPFIRPSIRTVTLVRRNWIFCCLLDVILFCFDFDKIRASQSAQHQRQQQRIMSYQSELLLFFQILFNIRHSSACLRVLLVDS